jgi:hypothetical protein
LEKEKEFEEGLRTAHICWNGEDKIRIVKAPGLICSMHRNWSLDFQYHEKDEHLEEYFARILKPFLEGIEEKKKLKEEITQLKQKLAKYETRTLSGTHD